MPIKVPDSLPARATLEDENIFVMTEYRAVHQDIRPLNLVILNLMPTKIVTETQLLRKLSNSPLQVQVDLLHTSSHISQNTDADHLSSFYTSFNEIKHRKYDGMIITGAPVENLDFTDVDYWDELVKIFEWANKNVTSSLYICWAAQAALYHNHGINKELLDEKLFGVYPHKVHHRKVPLVRGVDDLFHIPHSRYTTVSEKKIAENPELTVLADSDEAGIFLAMAQEGRQIFMFGHPEYDRMTLDREYKRDIAKNLDIDVPDNYYPDNNPDNKPVMTWRAHSNAIYSNWLNYYVYQVTPYEL